MMRILKQDELFSLIMSLLPQKPCIVEVGAYIGNHTLKFIKKCPDSTIFSFEPVPEIYQALQKNVANYPNIYLFNQAVSNTNDFGELYIAQHPIRLRQGHGGQASGREKKLCSASSLLKPQNRLNFSPIVYDKTITVETITLDMWYKSTFAKASSFTKVSADKSAVYPSEPWRNRDGVATPNNTLHISIDLLWIDAQGYEYEILEGAKNMLSQVKYIHTEVHFNQAYENQKDYTEVIEFLKKYNFTEIARDFNNIDDWFFGNILFKKSA